MTGLLDGEPTALMTVPGHWRGPLPMLVPGPPLPIKGGWVRVPNTLLHGGFPDLGVLAWVWLRLKFGDRPRETNYLEMAEGLGLQDLSARTAVKKFSVAVQPLLGSWVIRTKLDSHTFTYRAVTVAPDDRYALIRRGDLGLLALEGEKRAKAADLVNFGRWQLECGRLGWTVEPSRLIADRWKVTHPTIRQSRDRLAALGLLEVIQRSGSSRLSDLVWLKETYNPHWAVQHAPIEAVENSSGPWKESGDSTVTAPPLPGRNPGTGLEDVPGSLEENSGLDWKESADCLGRNPGTLIRNLTVSLSDELAELGGTPVPTLTLLPRDPVDPPPPASSLEERVNGSHLPDHRGTAVRLIGQHRVLASAKPHFRTAMIKRLTDALKQGLAPGHVNRALALVAEDTVLHAECLILKQALGQAWIDQRVGMCAECGDKGRHSPSCPQFDFSWDSSACASLEPNPCDTHTKLGTPVDPVALLLQRPVTNNPDNLSDDAEIVDWMTVQLARHIVDKPQRDDALDAVWTHWRAKLPPTRRALMDRASEHVRYALALRRVS